MNEDADERRLYRPIETLFEKQEYRVLSHRKKKKEERAHSGFPIEVNGETMIVDVAAFKWLDDSQIEAIAVECKLGKRASKAGSALYQATAYQVLFPKVYVAAEAPRKELNHVEKSLHQLGLGYIEVDGEIATEIFLPKHECNVRYDSAEFDRQPRSKIAAFLAFLEVFSGETQFGREKKMGEVFLMGKVYKSCNFLLKTENQGASMGLNIENKEPVKKFLSSVDIRGLHSLISNLSPEYHLVVKKFVGKKVHGITEERALIDKPVSEITLPILEDYKSQILKHLSVKDKCVDFQILRHVDLQSVSRGSIITEVKTMKEKIEPLYNLLVKHI
jgi:hypothetical protein